jgi:hypothetical protein
VVIGWDVSNGKIAKDVSHMNIAADLSEGMLWDAQARDSQMVDAFIKDAGRVIPGQSRKEHNTRPPSLFIENGVGIN